MSDRQARRRLREKMRRGLRRTAAELTREAKKRGRRHVDTGRLRQAVTYDDGPRGTVLWGYSLADAPHAKPLELGFRPHWVPARYVGRWMQRHGVGVSRRAGGRAYKTIRAVALGLYVGGPGSSLQYGGSAASGRIGNREDAWTTRGGRSRFLPAGKVGFPLLRETVAGASRTRLMAAFKRGWSRG